MYKYAFQFNLGMFTQQVQILLHLTQLVGGLSLQELQGLRARLDSIKTKHTSAKLEHDELVAESLQLETLVSAQKVTVCF